MAPDYDTERWEEARRERERSSKAASEITDRVHRGILTGDLGDAGDALGVPRAEAGAGRPGDDYQPTAAERFDFRREKLFYDLKSTSVLKDRVPHWTALVEALDATRPEDGLADMEWLWADFHDATRHPPPARDLFAAMPWEQQVPRLRDAIWQVLAVVDELAEHGEGAAG